MLNTSGLIINSKSTAFDLKALTLNALITFLCVAPELGWACFVLLTVVYAVASVRFALTNAALIRSLLAIVASVPVYFSGDLFGHTADRFPGQLFGIAPMQVTAVLFLVLFFHFRVYKPHRRLFPMQH